MRKPQKVNILGTEYSIVIKKQEEIQKALGNDKVEVDGLCDYQDKTIYIDDMIAKEPYSYTTTLRHEIVHAFIEESGLSTQVSWARNESLVDWIALQVPKISAVCSELNLLGGK